MQTLELMITDLARGGSGVAKTPEGMVVFIPYTAPGDRVRVELIETKKHYAQARLIELLSPGPSRVTPRCAVFGRCGGCQWQHIPYELQWKTKSQGVLQALARAGLPKPENWEEYPATHIWDYRNRVQLRGEGTQLGFFAPSSRDLVPADRCDIARPEINAAWEHLKKKGAQTGRPYKVEIEVLPDGSTREAWNSKHAAFGFRQIHDGQNEVLKTWITSHLTSRGTLLDLYGGIGNLSLELAAKMRRIECVDLGSPRQAPEGTPANYHFHRASVSEWLMQSEELGADAAAILDPPRIGLGEEFQTIERRLKELGVREIIAVGCDPDSWARDLLKFTKNSWVITHAATFDLFPQTPHVESVVRLSN